jgi:serine/threonine-protein kinase
MAYTAQLRLGGQIGSGQSGDVFEGLCPVHGQVAVKVLKQRAGESSADWALRSNDLIKEGQKLKAASHPNVVQVLQVLKDSTNDVIHLVVELCNGGSAEDAYMNGPLHLSQVRNIITGACRGLEHIHSCGMIHRDIKPANIMRHDHISKIGDFGLVSSNLLFGYASADGYVSHLAPEVFGDAITSGITSAKSDVWAMGMTTYRLLHGHDFYEQLLAGKSTTDIRQIILDGGFSRWLDWLPHVPEEWRRFVRKSMHDDTNQRFQTAHAMSQALARLPIVPSWSCTYTLKSVTWSRREDGRTITVEWTIHSPRRHEWYAKRTGGGKRDVSVGGTSGRILSSTIARSELDAFFAKSA